MSSEPVIFDYERATPINTDGTLTPLAEGMTRMTLQPAGKILLVLNGRDLNRRCANPEDAVVQPLQMLPPRGELYPIVGELGTGNVFGNDLKWRYRYKNSKTGERSGMSPVPSEGLNLGIETQEGSEDYLGVVCNFEIQGASYTGINATIPGGDRIELLRNTSQQQNVFLVVDEKANPGAGAVVLFEDNKEDWELSENAALYTNPDWDEGIMPPVLNAHQHGTGRTWYYCFERRGPYRLGTVSVTQDENLVTGTGTKWDRAWQGLAFRLLSGSDATVYRVIEVTADGTMYVSPKIKPNTSMTNGVMSTIPYELFDDRDMRTVWQSEPNQPTQMDMSRRFYMGFHADDPLYGVFSLFNQTMALTRKRLYSVSGDMTGDPSLDPSLTLQFSVRAEEGCAGPKAWCVTPFGLVYYSREHGVRLFDGRGDPRPLGQDSSLDRFMAIDQVRNVHPDYINAVTLFYDDDQHMVYFGYPPPGHPTPTEVMAFDPLMNVWRGPWQVCQYAQGQLLDSAGQSRCVYGDDRGNLFRMEQQAANMVNPATWTLTGDVASVSSPHHIGIDLNHDFQMNGIPLVCKLAGSGNPFVDATVRYARIIGRGDAASEIVLDRGLQGLTTSYDFWLGGIYWDIKTAYIDALEPVQPKTAKTVRLRFDRGDAGQTFYVGVSKDGDDTYSAETDTVATVNPDDSVRAEVRLFRGEASVFQYRFYGVTTTGGPVVTACDAALVIRSGGSSS